MSNPFGYGDYYSPFSARQKAGTMDGPPQGGMGGGSFGTPQSKGFGSVGVAPDEIKIPNLNFQPQQPAPPQWATAPAPQQSSFSGWGGGGPVNIMNLGPGQASVETPLRSDLFSNGSQNIGGWENALKNLQGMGASPWFEDRYRGLQELMNQVAAARAKNISASPIFDQAGFDDYSRRFNANPYGPDSDLGATPEQARGSFYRPGDWNSYEQSLKDAHRRLYEQFSGGGSGQSQPGQPQDQGRMRSF